MESSHVISITNEEENNNNIAQMKKEKTTTQIPLSSYLGKNKINCSLDPSSLRDNNNNNIINNNKHRKSDEFGVDIKNMIHSIKVGISLVLVSLLYILNPLFDQVGENAMWAIMTVVVIFEYNAGATLGKGFNRGIGTVLGGALGCLAAIFAQSIGGVGNSIFIATSVYIFGSCGTYFRLVPKIKKRYDYGVMVFMLTFNLVVVSGARPGIKVWDLAKERLLTILMGFIICICVSLLVFPLWASDELHDSTVSTFHNLANTIQGCLEECSKSVKGKENQLNTNFKVCKSVLNSKSKEESLANFAKWEPWHGKFGFSYPWEKYLKIGEVLRELATLILALECCLKASKKPKASLEQSKAIQLEQCEAIGSRIVWTLKEVGDSMKQMRKCESRETIMDKLKTTREELSLMISTSMISEFENGEILPIASLVFLLMEVVEKVGELVIQVGELQDIAGFRTNRITPLSS